MDYARPYLRMSVPDQIRDYIDTTDTDSIYRLKEYAHVFRPEWVNELNSNAYYYFRYINNRILKKEGVLS